MNFDAHLRHLSLEVLRDLARNESALSDWRKAAIEFLLERSGWNERGARQYVELPELLELVLEINRERGAVRASSTGD